MRTWQRYTPEFKAEALRRLKGCENVGGLARELKVSRGILYQWRDKQEGRSRKSWIPDRQCFRSCGDDPRCFARHL